MKRKPSTTLNVHEIFADVALLMLAAFVFVLVIVLISSRFAEQEELPRLREEVAFLKEQLEVSSSDLETLQKNFRRALVTHPDEQLETILHAASTGRKDFDLFVEGLKELPGGNLHLVVDATGSMHGLSTFIIPILRLIVIRSGKELDALTWFANHRAETYTGTMENIFDQLISEAPFAGHLETLGHAFRHAARHESIPGAYLLLGDEPSDDTISYSDIPSPVFSLPLGRDPATKREYETLSEKTGGKTLHLDFR